MTDIQEQLKAAGNTLEKWGHRATAKNVEKAADIIDELVEALERLTANTKPIADMVYNDNGDMTVTGHVTFDQITNVYWADKRAREALKAVRGDQQTDVLNQLSELEQEMDASRQAEVLLNKKPL